LGPGTVPPSLANERWFLSRNGKPLEPVPFEKLARLAVSDRLKPTDLVWKDGMVKWKPLANVRDLFAEAAPKARKATAARLASPPAEWFYFVGLNETPHGPITFAELQARARRGELHPSDLVMKRGGARGPARHIGNLFSTKG